MATANEMRIKLADACRKAGGVRQWAAAHGFSASTVYDILAGKEPMPNVVKALGYKRVPRYEPVAEAGEEPLKVRPPKPKNGARGW